MKSDVCMREIPKIIAVLRGNRLAVFGKVTYITNISQIISSYGMHVPVIISVNKLLAFLH